MRLLFASMSLAALIACATETSETCTSDWSCENDVCECDDGSSCTDEDSCPDECEVCE